MNSRVQILININHLIPPGLRDSSPFVPFKQNFYKDLSVSLIRKNFKKTQDATKTLQNVIVELHLHSAQH